jgi:hypothetical protein
MLVQRRVGAFQQLVLNTTTALHNRSELGSLENEITIGKKGSDKLKHLKKKNAVV